MSIKNYASTLSFGLLFLLFSGNSGFAQSSFKTRPEFIKANSNWFTGGSENLRFDFTTSPATVTEIVATSPNPGTTLLGESATAVSDTATGDLLFFTNGSRCYNANYALMPNGEGLMPNLSSGGSYSYDRSTNQGSVIIPVIDSPGKFYVFSLSSTGLGGGGVLYYSKVDMSLDGGLGDVVADQKMIPLDAGPLQEGMAAVPGNNNDVWLLVHPHHDTFFKAYHVTAAGVDMEPVLSSPGSMISGDVAAFECGNIAVSPMRDMIGIGSYSFSCLNLGLVTSLGGYLVARFDPCTGQVSDGVKVEDSIGVYGSYFSPDGSKIYIEGMKWDTTGTMNMGGDANVVQYDLSSYVQADIMASKYVVHDFFPDAQFFSLRTWNDTMIVSDKTFIASPNEAGAACDFHETSYFPTLVVNDGSPEGAYGAALSWGSDAIYPVPADTAYRLALDTMVCGTTTLHAPAGFLVYSWDDGSTDSLREVSNAGTYWVAYNDGCDYKVDTFHVDLADLNPIITVDVFELGTTLPYDSYQWLLNGELLDGATDNTYTVLENGDYQVIVGNEFGCTDTSSIYTVTNVGIEDAHVMAPYVHVYPNPATDVIHIQSAIAVAVEISTVEGRVLLSVDKYKEPIPVNALSVGMYLIRIYDMDGRVIKTEKLIKNP